MQVIEQSLDFLIIWMSKDLSEKRNCLSFSIGEVAYIVVLLPNLWKGVAHFSSIFMVCHVSFNCSKQQSVIQQLQARKGRLIVICSKGDANLMCPNGGCRVIEVPQLQDCLQPIINIVPFQVCKSAFSNFGFIFKAT